MTKGKADIHIHTTYSDGEATIEEILDYVENKTDLDVIAITDHDTITGAKKAQKEVGKRGLRIKVIIGEEVTTKDGHIVGLFLKKQIPRGLTAHQALLEIKKQHGLTLVPHPFFQTYSQDTSGNSLGGVGIETIVKESNLTDAVETINGNILMNFGGNQRARYINRNFLFKSETGGSDSHILSTIGNVYTEFIGKSPNKLKQSILSKNTTPVQVRPGISNIIKQVYYITPHILNFAAYQLKNKIYEISQKFRKSTSSFNNISIRGLFPVTLQPIPKHKTKN